MSDTRHDPVAAKASDNKPHFSDPLSIDPDFPTGDQGKHLDRDDLMRFPANPDQKLQDQNRIDLLNSDVEKFQKGDVGASLELLKDINYLDFNNGLDKLLTKMEDSGQVQVVKDDKGNPTHLIFNGDGTHADVDLNLKDGSINNESKFDLRDDAAKQAKEYLADKLADDRFRTDPTHKTDDVVVPSPEGRKATTELMSALIDHDSAKLKELSQEILNDPALLGNVKSALSQLQESTIKVGVDAKGNPCFDIATNGGTNLDIRLDQSGNMTLAAPDSYYGGQTPNRQIPGQTPGDPRFDNMPAPAENIETTLLRASNYALKYADRGIMGTQRVLESENKGDDKYYLDMSALINAYYDAGLSQYF